MRGFDRLKQESVKPQGFSAPSAGRSALSQAPRADAASLCKTANREMRSQMQIAKRFANQGKATKQISARVDHAKAAYGDLIYKYNFPCIVKSASL